MDSSSRQKLSCDRIGTVEVYQPLRGYRCGVEAPLLARFAAEKRFQRAADLGTGVGVLAILVASMRRKCVVDAVEIQPRLADLACRNVEHNGFGERISIVRADARTLEDVLPARAYDLVFGNPPFRKLGTGRISPRREVALARREELMSLEDWTRSAGRLLRDGGRCCLVQDASRFADVLRCLRDAGIEPKRLRMLHHDAGHEASLVLVEGGKSARPGLVVEPPLFVADQKDL